jgi:hypothetical protein
MSKRRTYPRDPRKLSRDAWFYEEPRGIQVVIEHRDEFGGYIGTVRTRLTWARLDKAVRNHHAIKRQRRVERKEA